MLIVRSLVFAGFAAVAAVAGFGESLLEKFDPRMAVEKSVVTNGMRWIDGRLLPMEGRMFDDAEFFYDRLPAKAKVSGGVSHMKHFSAGLQFRFTTDSKKLVFRWKNYSKELDGGMWSRTGKSGIDVYRYDAKRGKWFHCATGTPGEFEKGGQLRIEWKPGEACLVNLPNYNGIAEFSLGIEPTASVSAPPPHRGITTKPVVFYGTSITHGGIVTRPGMAFPSIVGRRLDVPIVNLGFSGCGRMEMEMTEYLARIDASCYVLDCLWNMWGEAGLKNFEPFIRKLRELKPDVPIVIAERCDMRYRDETEHDASFDKDHAFVRAIYDKLVAEGWKKLVYLPSEKQTGGDGDSTVDTCHPNDWGMMYMAGAFAEAVKEAVSSK